MQMKHIPLLARTSWLTDTSLCPYAKPKSGNRQKGGNPDLHSSFPPLVTVSSGILLPKVFRHSPLCLQHLRGKLHGINSNPGPNPMTG